MGFWSHDTSTATPSGVKILDLPNDRPQFKRRYTVPINDDISMKIELRTSYGGSRYDSSELDQSNGKWVLFDAKAPADKILDREILPAVERFCAEILALDAAFVRGSPNEFVDDAGVKWRRVE